ncbi:hypothetical protein ACFQZS_05725 [Mucilaginibacter calamicampi]|uniref:O-Antigen ligase n=1 Tax=Mucilaginibacter calamicampi TaxID=1302352 RepID=A0ABW2YT69_9SPHI
MDLNLKASDVGGKLLFASFFIPYIGLISPAYAIIIFLTILRVDKSFKITMYDFIYIVVLLLFLLIKFSQVGFGTGEAIFRYYLGAVILYHFVKVYDIKMDIQTLIFAFCVCVIIEAVVINIFFDPFRYLPNYPISVYENNLTSHYTKFMGFYQRPYSVGMNSSASSTVLCAAMIYRDVLVKKGLIIADRKIELLGLITVLMMASGVGLILYFFYILFKFNILTVKRSLILFSILILLFLYYPLVSEYIAPDSIFQKVSAGYIQFLSDYKTQQVEDVIAELHEPGNSMFIGKAFESKADITLQSDFAWNDMFICLGLGGITLFIMFFINKVNKYTVFPLLLLLLGAFHYGGMFTLAGQIVLVLILTTDYESESELETQNQTNIAI